jgi:hypothetical protein
LAKRAIYGERDRQARASIRLLTDLVLIVAVACALACGSNSPPSFKTSAKQAASTEAQDAGPLRQAIAYEQSCNSFDCLVAINLLNRWGKIADYAATLSADLKAAKPVDPEVAKLTDDTIASLNRVSTSYAAFNSCARQAGSVQPCESEENGAESAWRAIPNVLDGWKPYGGA